MRPARLAGIGIVLIALLGLAVWLASTGGFQRVINSPYPVGESASNTLFTAFTGRSPRYLDPASSYSSDETPYTYNIYQPLYAYHYLKRPYELIPYGAASFVAPRYFDAQGVELPPDTPGHLVAQSVYDIPIRQNVRYAPHPAFARQANGDYVYYPLLPGTLEGVRGIPDFAETGSRELTAHDYVYQIRRMADPRIVAPIFSKMGDYIVGYREYGEQLRALVEQRRQNGTDHEWLDLRELPFSGVEALDDHTLRIRLMGSYPQFHYWLAMSFFVPMPWEADRFYQQPGMAERNLTINEWPVGTGPYYLAENRVNWRLVLQRNPYFNSLSYPCDGPLDGSAMALLTDCGKPLPFIDRVVFNIEKESVPLQGKFLQGYYDIPQVDRGEYGVAFRVAAEDSPDKAALFAERGLQLPTAVEAGIWYIGFNWLDPVVGGGNTPEQAERNRKLRQAISIVLDWEQYLALFEANQGQVAYGPVPPGILGYRSGPEGINPTVYDVVDGRAVRKSLEEARRLLAEAGYPDGRSLESGQPLVLHFDAMGGASGSRPQYDWLQRQLAKLGVQLEIRSTDYNRFQDKMRNGVAQIFMWGWLADYPDAENFLFLLYGPNAKVGSDGENASNYRNPEFDALFERMRYLQDGPEKEQLVWQMTDIVQRDAPWLFGYYPASGGAYQQWVGNAHPSQMIRNTLPYLKIDAERRTEKIALWNEPVWWPLLVLLLLAILIAWPAWRMLRRRERATALEDRA